MSSCNHFDLFEAYQHCVADTDRFNRLTWELRDAQRQYPSTLLLLGAGTKGEALRSVFSNHKSTQRRKAIANLYLEQSTLQCLHPLLYIDADLHARQHDPQTISRCHELHSHKITWQQPDSVSFRQLIFARHLFLFTDVVCLFADDFTSFSAVQDILLSWVACGPASVLPVSVKPRVVIFTTSEDKSSLQLQRECMLDMSKMPGFRSTFSAVRMVEGEFALLRDVLLEEELVLARQAKMAASLSFSAAHLAWICQNSLQHFCATLSEPFSHYQCFFERGKSERFVENIKVFLSLTHVAKEDSTLDDIHAYIASVFFHDMFPGGSHVFDAGVLFDIVYRRIIDELCADNHSLQGLLSASIIRGYVEQYAKPMHARQKALSLHSRNLPAFAARQPWNKLRTNAICLSCLQGAPQHCLYCKHSLCDQCVKTWGKLSHDQECSYSLERCPLCLEQNPEGKIILKPPTAGVRVLTSDGGGVRGIVPLLVLREVEERLGFGVRDCFDLVLGSSSGGLGILGLFAMKWPVTECIARFTALAEEIFRRRGTIGILGRLKNTLSALVTDSAYDVHQYESILKEQFGHFSRLFDSALDGCSRFKIAVTATNITDGSPFILSNYNGSAPLTESTGYAHARAETAADDPLIWQAARATTAAFSLFPVIALPIGTFQDGGSREHNNPTPLALWESRRIWAAGTAFDVVLSLGTGTAVRTSLRAPPSRGTLRDGFIPRLVRSTLRGMDGEVQARNTANMVNTFEHDTQAKWFRLNISSNAQLDDAAALPELCQAVCETQVHRKTQVAELCKTLLASFFFFELDGLPTRDKRGDLKCTGHVRIRGDASLVLTGLRRLSKRPYAFFLNRHSLGTLDLGANTCTRCLRFSQYITFTLRNAEEKIRLCLQFDGEEHQISGFPQTIAWFVKQQRLDSHHQSRRGRDPSCYCGANTMHGEATLIRQKRKLSLTNVDNKASRLTVLRLDATAGESWL